MSPEDSVGKFQKVSTSMASTEFYQYVEKKELRILHMQLLCLLAGKT